MFKKELEYIRAHKHSLEMISWWNTTKDKSEAILTATYSNTPTVITHNHDINVRANEAMNIEMLNDVFISLDNYKKGEITDNNAIIFSNKIDKHNSISVILSFKEE